MLGRMRITQKVAAIVAIPALGLLFFAGAGVAQRLSTEHNVSSLRQLSELAVRVSSFVHESQKERGATGVFVGSKGAKFAPELAAQRKLTDERRAALDELLTDFDTRHYGAGFEADLDAALDDYYAKLDAHRKTVDALAIDGQDAIGFYSKMNETFLGAIAHIANLGTDAGLSRIVSAYVNFLQAKERTGRERAIMSNAFARGHFVDEAEFAKFLTAVNGQEDYLSVFRSYASADELAFFESTLKGVSVTEAARMRQVALDHAGDASLGGIDAAYWFARMTEKINLLKEVEDKLSADLTGKAAALEHDARVSLLTFAVLGLLGIAVALALAFAITRAIVRDLRLVAGASEQIGEGDLTITVDTRSNDEIGDMGRSFQRMVEKLRVLLAKVSEASATISASSEQMATTSEEAGRAVGDIAGAISEVARGADRQVKTVDAAKRLAEEMAAAVSTSAIEAQQTADAAQQAQLVAEEGVGAATAATEAAAAAIAELSSKSAQIGGIVETITGIAGQTNLLALNAAIEAARAGEQGRGFAVVAEEVRKLAEESQEAAADIARLIGEIQAETERVVEVVRDSAERTEGGATTVEGARDAFLSIGERVRDMAARVEQIAGATQQVAAGAASVQESMSEITEVAQQSSASTEQVSAAAQESSASAQQIAASAQELARTAEELELLVANFRLA